MASRGFCTHDDLSVLLGHSICRVINSGAAADSFNRPTSADQLDVALQVAKKFAARNLPQKRSSAAEI
tara:strand:- start:231 stop:434 length:204 start_codon:yes stop_codon:yes gene_type:complete